MRHEADDVLIQAVEYLHLILIVWALSDVCQIIKIHNLLLKIRKWELYIQQVWNDLISANY